MIRTFEQSFVTEYQTAFTELLRLGTVAAQKKVAGKESSFEDSKAERLFTVLQALDSPDLTAKEIEALEYCLISLNVSLITPTVQRIVSVSAPAETTDRLIRLLTGFYAMTMQEVVMNYNRNLVLTAEQGSFTFTGQDVTLTYNRVLEMTADQGSFVYTGQSATLTYDERQRYIYGLTLNEAVAGSPSWRATFDDGATSKQLDVTGNGATDADFLKSAADVTVTVWKISNAGVTEDAGEVIFYLNGVVADTQTFTAAENLDGTGTNYKQYVFMGLSEGDQLDAIITEG